MMGKEKCDIVRYHNGEIMRKRKEWRKQGEKAYNGAKYQCWVGG
jgi:hypothetical protein